jgi:hypothetical protein
MCAFIGDVALLVPTSGAPLVNSSKVMGSCTLFLDVSRFLQQHTHCTEGKVLQRGISHLHTQQVGATLANVAKECSDWCQDEIAGRVAQ